MKRIAVLQLVSAMDVQSNLDTVTRLVTEAAEKQVDAVFLPENFAALANPEPRVIGEAEMSPGGPIRGCLASLARTTETILFAGTMPCSVRPDGEPVAAPRVRAASIVYDASGAEMARYDKMHMFDVEVSDNQKHYLESATFEPGEALVCLETGIGKVGLSVCYDIRFPEFYRKLFVRGAELFAIPSAFTQVTGEAHFEVLMRSRAIENFSFTVAACQGGEHDSGRKTHGHSMVVSPWGEILVEADRGEALLIAELDVDRQQEIRRDMPVLRQMKIPV